MRTLILARHGNTFHHGETPRRVGARTDLPLVEDERARAIGRYLRDHQWIPDRVLAAPLLRTTQTAQWAIEEMGIARTLQLAPQFCEIDYGPDENQPEPAVVARIGQVAIDAWNREAIVPAGWNVDVAGILRAWREMARSVAMDERVLLVTSNGILRFAPCILQSDTRQSDGVEFVEFAARYGLKVATGGVCVFTDDGNGWTCLEWNVRPQ